MAEYVDCLRNDKSEQLKIVEPENVYRLTFAWRNNAISVSISILSISCSYLKSNLTLPVEASVSHMLDVNFVILFSF